MYEQLAGATPMCLSFELLQPWTKEGTDPTSGKTDSLATLALPNVFWSQDRPEPAWRSKFILVWV